MNKSIACIIALIVITPLLAFLTHYIPYLVFERTSHLPSKAFNKSIIK